MRKLVLTQVRKIHLSDALIHCSTLFTTLGTYSGLETEAFVALALASICLTSFELMRRKRRKTKAYMAAVAAGEGRELGSVESWEWG